MRLRVIELSPNRTAVADAAAWAALSFAVGYAMHRRPAEAFASDGLVTAPRSFEAGGRFYERHLAIAAWKDRMPEAGAFFAGGFSKAGLASRDTAHLERYVVETRRAELTHWALVACTPVFALWNPPALVAAQAAYALASNLPCIAIQRYNRSRLERVLQRRRRTTPAPAGVAQSACSMR